MFGFEKLEVWQAALDFADAVYEPTTNFPTDERFGLTAQMRRAAISVSSNIAEGSSRSSSQDFARFLEIAYGSVIEVVSQATIAKRRSLLEDAPYRDLYERAERLARMLRRIAKVARQGTLTIVLSPQPSTLNPQPSTPLPPAVRQRDLEGNWVGTKRLAGGHSRWPRRPRLPHTDSLPANSFGEGAQQGASFARVAPLPRWCKHGPGRSARELAGNGVTRSE